MRPVKRALPRPQYMKYTLDKNISERNSQNGSAIAYTGAKLKTVSGSHLQLMKVYLSKFGHIQAIFNCKTAENTLT